MTSARVAALLDAIDALSDAQRRQLQFDPDWQLLMARLKFRPDEAVPFEQLDLALELSIRYPHSLEHYRTRAEAARCSRDGLTDRLTASVPFKVSAGARQ